MMIILVNLFNNTDPTLLQWRVMGKGTYSIDIRDPTTGQFEWPTFAVQSHRYPANVVKERDMELLQGRIKPRTLLLKHVDTENRRKTLIYDCSVQSSDTYGLIRKHHCEIISTERIPP